MITKTAMIAVIGRPNVGKSTLVNAMVGEKISIVSPKPQTTRYRIFGVAERGDTQLVFADTPGFHKARNKLGEYMVKVVAESVSDVDAACLVVEPKANVGMQEELLIERIKELGKGRASARNRGLRGEARVRRNRTRFGEKKRRDRDTDRRAKKICRRGPAAISGRYDDGSDRAPALRRDNQGEDADGARERGAPRGKRRNNGL